jgi:hypothetical protein
MTQSRAKLEHTARLEIGDALPSFEESPFMICGALDYVRIHLPCATRLEITRHGGLVVAAAISEA